MRTWRLNGWLGRLALALALGGCSSMSGGRVPTEKYHATFSAEGVIVVPPVSLGEIDVPVHGEGLVSLAVAIAGKRLAEQHRLSSCLFESYPPRLNGRTITVTASAACRLDGLPVTQIVTLALEPVAVPS